MNPYLYRYNARRFNGSALLWAAGNGQLETALKALNAGAEVQPPGPLVGPGL